MLHIPTRIWLGAALLLSGAAGCVTPGGSCVSGTSIECSCAAGVRGVQVCGRDNNYAPCTCEGRLDGGADGITREDAADIRSEARPDVSSIDGGLDTIDVTIPDSAVRDASAADSFSDAGAEMGSVIDARTDASIDAADTSFDAAGICPAAPADGGVSWTTLLPAPRTLPCFNCGVMAVPAIANVRLSAPTQVTMWRGHHLTSFTDTEHLGIASDCTMDPFACIASSGYPMILTRLLGPGMYQLETCSGAMVALEAPVAPTNTTCATAIPFTNDGTRIGAVQARVLDSTPRYYTISWPGCPGCPDAYPHGIGISSDMRIGYVHSISVRRVCGDGTTEVASGVDGWAIFAGPPGHIFVDMSRVPAGTYYVVASGIDQGLQYRLWLAP